MKWSDYNYIFQHEGENFLYNSLSNSFASIDDSTYEIMLNVSDMVDFTSIDSDLRESLIKMKAIVEDDRDEMLKIKYMSTCCKFDNQRLLLTINPTLGCNFACPYCFEKEHKSIHMSDDVEDGIIKFIKGYKQIKVIDVTWFGGEPLLAFSRIQSLTKKMHALGVKYRAGIITNGYLLNQDVIEKLDELNIKSIQITIDGLKTVHDDRRCLRSGKGTFDRIISNIDLLKTSRPDIHLVIRMNIDKVNKSDFVSLYNFIKERNYPNTHFSPSFVENPTNMANDVYLLTKEEQADFVKQLYNDHKIEYTHFFPSSQRKECAIRNPYSIVIGPEGELYKCWNDVGDKNKVYGYIDGRITNERLLLRYLNGAEQFEDEKCRNCILLPVCSGGCPYYRIQNEFEGKNNNNCPLIKHNLKDFLLLHYHQKKATSR